MITIKCDNCGKQDEAKASGYELDVDLDEKKWLRINIAGPFQGDGIVCSEACAVAFFGDKITLTPRPERKRRRCRSYAVRNPSASYSEDDEPVAVYTPPAAADAETRTE